MSPKPVLISKVFYLLHVIEREDLSIAEIVSVFKADNSRLNKVLTDRWNDVLNILQVKGTV